MTRRAITILSIVAALSFAFAGFVFVRVNTEISGRRARNHAADVRVCEVAMNVSAGRFLALITQLGAIAPPPANEAEAEYRAKARQILAAALVPIDCEVFVATGRAVPAAVAAATSP